MKKAVNFLIAASFFCLSDASYADKYGEFMALTKTSASKVCLKVFAEALRETVEKLELTAKNEHECCIGNCFGFGSDVINAFPAYVFRFKKLKKYYDANDLKERAEEADYTFESDFFRCQQLIKKTMKL